MRRGLAAVLLLGLAARAVGAQEPILLRANRAIGLVTRYRSDMDTWMRTPLLASADTSLPTVHVTMHSTRTVLSADSGVFLVGTLIDSSHFDMPAVTALAPQLAQSGDFLRGLRTETRSDTNGKGQATRVVAAPNMPNNLPTLIRGVQSLALTGMRLTSFTLPDHPIGPGATWSDTVSIELASSLNVAVEFVEGGGRSLGTFTLERFEQRDGRRIAIITSAGRISGSGGDAGASATLVVTARARYDFDVAAGTIVHAQMDLEGPLSTRYGVIPTRMHLVMQVL